MLIKRNVIGHCLGGIALALTALTAVAFQLSPSGTPLERYQVKVNSAWYQRYTSGAASWGVYQFTHPVHEEITQLIFDCDAGEGCTDPEMGFAPTSVIAGVRWNDDPPFRLTTTGIPECRSGQTIRVVTQPICWYKLFKHAEKRSETTYFDGNSKRWNIMYRSHFGDLQFLHAMASKDGETAAETRRRIFMWAEFAWSVATGKLEGNVLLKDIETGGLNSFFPKSGQSVEDLYTLGNSSLRRSIRDVAFGSLLHLIEDSFAFGHVERLPPAASTICAGSDQSHPGKIRSFRSYTNQDHKKHGMHDSRESFQKNLEVIPTAVDIGKVLLGMYDRKEPWDKVSSYLDCVFELENPDAKASPGDGLGR